MKSVDWLLVVGLFLPLAIAGCGGSMEPASTAKQYLIKGKVVAVDLNRPAVKLDHEEIPGLMKAMEMEYAVEDAKVLDGLKIGDKIQGHLKVESGEYVVTHLEKF